MKNKDIIRPFEKSLFVQFGSTGELQNVNTLRLDQGITFSCAGTLIEARYHDGAGTAFLVERFPSELLARSAFESLQATVQRYARHRRVASFSKNIMKWGVAPIILVMLALAINMVATRAAGENPAGSAPLTTLPANLAALPQPSAPAPRAPVTSPAELAKAMADGVKAGKYSIQLSSGSKGTLYVFSDPSCTHCQSLEPELDKLAKNYTIHIFPVTVIGGASVSQHVAELLCAKQDRRGALWKRLVSGGDLEGKQCAEGSTAVDANDQIFRVMQFAGTPTIINAAGEQVPDSTPNTAEAIDQWMTASSTGQQ